MKFTEFAKQHGGEVPKSEELRQLTRKLICTGRLIYRAHEFKDGTYLLGRMALAHEGNKLCIWKKIEKNCTTL